MQTDPPSVAKRPSSYTEKKQPTDWRLTASMLCPKKVISKVIYLSTHLATRILTSYSKYNGMVTRIRVIKSGGVITAATSIMMRNECFRYFNSISEDTNPSFVNAKAITGN